MICSLNLLISHLNRVEISLRFARVINSLLSIHVFIFPDLDIVYSVQCTLYSVHGV